MTNRGTGGGDIKGKEISMGTWITFSVDEFLEAAETVYSNEDLRQLKDEIDKIITNKQEVDHDKTNLPDTEFDKLNPCGRLDIPV